MKPYSEPIVTEGKIVEKYTFPDDSIYHTLTFWRLPIIIPQFYIVTLSEKGYRTKISVGEKKYSSLEVDDSVEITEHSRLKKTVEKNGTYTRATRAQHDETSHARRYPDEMRGRDTFLPADECLKNGLVDNIVTEPSVLYKNINI